MIIWPLRLGIKLPEQNIRFLRDCHYSALLPAAVEWRDVHRLESLAGFTARFYFENFSKSLLINKRHTVWFEIKCLSQKGNPMTSQVLLSPVHLTRLVVSSCGTRKLSTDTTFIPGHSSYSDICDSAKPRDGTTNEFLHVSNKMYSWT